MGEENGLGFTDPQFMNTLESCLKAEIVRLKSCLADQNAGVKKVQVEVAWKWKEAKELDERMKDCQKNIEFFSTILKSLKRDDSNMKSQLHAKRANLDDAFRIMSHEIKHHEQILKQYQDTWEQYKMKYEDLPLTKTCNKARINLEKLRIQEMVLEYKHRELVKKIQQTSKISWLRLRSKIVEFAEAVLENRQLSTGCAIRRDKIKKSKEELRAITAELEVERRKSEDEMRKRSQLILAMPPPKIQLPLVHRSNDFRHTESRKSREQWQNNYKAYADSDSISISASIYEEIMLHEDEESASQKGSEPRKHHLQRSRSNTPEPSPRRTPEETLNITPEDREERQTDEQENKRQIIHEPTPTRNIPIVDLGSPEENREADRACPAPSEMELEPAMKRMRMTVNQEEYIPEDASCSTIKIYGRQYPERWKIPRENSAASEKMHQAQAPRIVNVEKVQMNVFPKFGRPSVPEPVAQSTHSFRPHYCESETPSGMDGIANLAEQSSFCADSIANFNFSECSNITPPASMIDEGDLQATEERRSSVQQGSKTDSFRGGLNFGASSSFKPGGTKFF